MSNREVTVVFNKKMKMSDLVDGDYRLLLLLHHLKINLGFGEKSVEVVCAEHNFDVDCFLFLTNFWSNKGTLNIEEEFDKLPLDPFLYYLECTHSYFLDFRLPNIRRKLKILFADAKGGLQKMVLDFFDIYYDEVNEHMTYEDKVVFPYIQSLLTVDRDKDYSIQVFEERHNDIEEKVNDLKQLLMKYVTNAESQDLMVNILMELYMSEEELTAHTFIEDNLVIPKVKALEKRSV